VKGIIAKEEVKAKREERRRRERDHNYVGFFNGQKRAMEFKKINARS
jgi:hypothetical protein